MAQPLLGRTRSLCQSASKTDPPSAANIDPPRSCGIGSVRSQVAPSTPCCTSPTGSGHDADCSSGWVIRGRRLTTGTPRPDHDFQVRVYAVLWARDETLNPCARHADRLVVSYRDHDVVVPPPGESEINALEVEMSERAEAAHAALAGDAPEARPGHDVCRHCHVRQLCTDYWRGSAPCARPLSANASALLVDLEVSIREQERPLAWRGELLAGGGLQPGTPVVIQHPHGDIAHLSAIRNGQVVRLIDVVLTMPSADSQVAVVSFGVSGEAFALLA